MIRLRLATTAALAGALLAAGCASPCGGCGGGTSRFSFFRARAQCPCECCSNVGGVPVVTTGSAFGDGPLLEPPGPAMATMPPPGLPSAGLTPSPLPPSLGAPLGTPAIPTDPGRLAPIPNALSPIPNAAPQVPAEGSSRVRR